MEKYTANTNQKKPGVYWHQTKWYFRTKNTSDKYHFVIKERSANQDIIILKDYACNRKASKYIKIKTELKGEIDESTFIIRYFNTFFSIILRNMFQDKEKVCAKDLRSVLEGPKQSIVFGAEGVEGAWFMAGQRGRQGQEYIRSCGPW